MGAAGFAYFGHRNGVTRWLPAFNWRSVIVEQQAPFSVYSEPYAFGPLAVTALRVFGRSVIAVGPAQRQVFARSAPRTCDGCRALAIAADRQGRRRVRRGVCRLGDAWSAHARTHTHRWFTVGSGIHQLAKLVVLIIDVSDSMRVRVITRCSQSGRRLE